MLLCCIFLSLNWLDFSILATSLTDIETRFPGHTPEPSSASIPYIPGPSLLVPLVFVLLFLYSKKSDKILWEAGCPDPCWRQESGSQWGHWEVTTVYGGCWFWSASLHSTCVLWLLNPGSQVGQDLAGQRIRTAPTCCDYCEGKSCSPMLTTEVLPWFYSNIQYEVCRQFEE